MYIYHTLMNFEAITHILNENQAIWPVLKYINGELIFTKIVTLVSCEVIWGVGMCTEKACSCGSRY